MYYLKNNIMKKIIRLTESDLTRIVRRVIKENKNSDVFEDDKCYDENGKEIPCDNEDNAREITNVTVMIIRLKQGPHNPDGILGIRYNSETGQIIDATDRTVIMNWQKNKTLDELADFLRRNKLIKRSQKSNIKQKY
jgi:hypothetical protein